MKLPQLLLSLSLLGISFTGIAGMEKPAIPLNEQFKNKLVTKALFKGIRFVTAAALAYYCAERAATIAHEFGHGIAAKLLLGIPCKYHISLKPFGIASAEPLIDPPTKGYKAALCALNGPLFGILSHCFILKLNNILHECIENKNISINTIQKGLSVPLLHHILNGHDHYGIAIGILCAASGDILTNLMQLNPYTFEAPDGTIATTDGYKFFNALKKDNLE